MQSCSCRSPSHTQTAPRSPLGSGALRAALPSSSCFCLLWLGLLVAFSGLDSRIASTCLLVPTSAVPVSSLGSLGTARASGPGSFLPFKLQRGAASLPGLGQEWGADLMPLRAQTEGPNRTLVSWTSVSPVSLGLAPGETGGWAPVLPQMFAPSS